mmetsp:Transcript_51280/g.129445  ORF Transcript_51280/g.129445 Transcript_51280/m.129445 type:complete len:361 (-) Transcript_51280:76-1158(-)
MRCSQGHPSHQDVCDVGNAECGTCDHFGLAVVVVCTDHRKAMYFLPFPLARELVHRRPPDGSIRLLRGPPPRPLPRVVDRARLVDRGLAGLGVRHEEAGLPGNHVGAVGAHLGAHCRLGPVLRGVVARAHVEPVLPVDVAARPRRIDALVRVGGIEAEPVGVEDLFELRYTAPRKPLLQAWQLRLQQPELPEIIVEAVQLDDVLVHGATQHLDGEIRHVDVLGDGQALDGHVLKDELLQQVVDCCLRNRRVVVVDVHVRVAHLVRLPVRRADPQQRQGEADQARGHEEDAHQHPAELDGARLALRPNLLSTFNLCILVSEDALASFTQGSDTDAFGTYAFAAKACACAAPVSMTRMARVA